MVWTMKHFVYNRKRTTIVDIDRHMAVVITRRYAIDIGWSKSGVTPGGGGSNPTICSDLAVREDCMIIWWSGIRTQICERSVPERKRLAREYPTEIGREYGLIDAFNKECRLTKVTVSTTEDRDVIKATFKPCTTNKCFFQEDSWGIVRRRRLES